MASFIDFISASLGLLLLTQCSIKQPSNDAAQIFPLANTQPGNPLAGEWNYTHDIWYASDLTLQDDGTFKFHDQGCFGQKFSKGKWINCNGIIQLTSFESFKEQAKNGNSKEAGNQKKVKMSVKKDGIAFSTIGFESVSPPILPSAGDTIRIYLDRILLQLRNDTLYCISCNKLPGGASFTRQKPTAIMAFVLWPK